jgi:hypothetical protein
VKGISPAITAQRRINCYVSQRQEGDRTLLALIGSPGLTPFCTTIGVNPSRGMWPVDTLATPLLFTVHGNTLYSINNAGITSVIGTIGTTSGDVSMVDDGTNLVLVDGFKGYYYNLITPAGLNQIVSGNFPANPTTVTWQDTYFIVTDGLTNQFNLSANGDPTTWPAVQINFTGAAPGALQAGIADHSILNLFGGVFSEFWQDTGLENPYSPIPGSAQEYGLAAAFSLCKYDNSLAGLFKNRMGEVNVSRMSGFRLQQLSDEEMDFTLNSYASVADCKAFGYMNAGHPMLQLGFPSAQKTWEFDQRSNVWSERQDTNGNRYWAHKFASFVNRQLVSDYRNGNIYEINPTVYTDAEQTIPMEIWTRHIWQDDKYLTIPQLQVDIEAGVGLTSGQGVNPQLMLDVSKDGGQTFTAVSWSSMGPIGQYAQRVIWRRLGRARDWVLKLRITDPVRRIITGCSAEVTGGTF